MTSFFHKRAIQKGTEWIREEQFYVEAQSLANANTYLL